MISATTIFKSHKDVKKAPFYQRMQAVNQLHQKLKKIQYFNKHKYDIPRSLRRKYTFAFKDLAHQIQQIILASDSPEGANTLWVKPIHDFNWFVLKVGGVTTSDGWNIRFIRFLYTGYSEAAWTAHVRTNRWGCVRLTGLQFIAEDESPCPSKLLDIEGMLVASFDNIYCWLGDILKSRIKSIGVRGEIC